MNDKLSKLLRRNNSTEIAATVQVLPVSKGIEFLDGPYKGKYLDEVIELHIGSLAGEGNLKMKINHIDDGYEVNLRWSPRRLNHG